MPSKLGKVVHPMSIPAYSKGEVVIEDEIGKLDRDKITWDPRSVVWSSFILSLMRGFCGLSMDLRLLFQKKFPTA